MAIYDVNKEIFFELYDNGRRGHDQNLLESLLSVTELSMIGSHYRHNVYIAVR